jgi:hypothetical protein
VVDENLPVRRRQAACGQFGFIIGGAALVGADTLTAPIRHRRRLVRDVPSDVRRRKLKNLRPSPGQAAVRRVV